MRSLRLLGLIGALLACLDIGLASPHAARTASKRFARSAKRAVSYDNPLLVSRQVKADSIRFPAKAKRACPSNLPNGNCACPTGTTYCAAEDDCINVLGSDSANCGSCGATCGSGEICSAGTCICNTAAGYNTQCTGYCLLNLDIFSDSSNCGGCGIVCPSGTSCQDASCVCPPIPGLEYCPASKSCVSIYTDPLNCGACSRTCTSTEVCTNGACTCAACGTGEVCQSGACVCDTASGYISCDGACVLAADFQTDIYNCGSCGSVCPTGGVCQGGACSCPSGTYCLASNECVDVSNDSKNCAGCGNVCPANTICQKAACVCDPNDQPAGCCTGYTSCYGQCLLPSTFMSDDNNCGSCRNICGPGATCLSGTCVCSAGFTMCHGTCISNSARCNVLGNIGIAYTSDPSTIVCYMGGASCKPTATVYNQYYASLGVSNQPIIFAYATGQENLIEIAPPSGSEDYLTELNDVTAFINTVPTEFAPETPPYSPPQYAQTGGSGFYETDTWSVTSSGVSTSGGTGYRMSATWTNEDLTTVPLILIYSSTYNARNDFPFWVTANPDVLTPDFNVALFYFIPT